MQPAPPSVTPGRGALRGAFAVLLLAFIAAVVGAQPPAPAAAQPKPEDRKDEPKKEPPEPKWPTEINGKSIGHVLKDLKDPDPVNREQAARTLPSFGPAARKEAVSKVLVERMVAERDPGVRFAVYSAIGSITFESERDNTEALRILNGVIDTAASGSSSRYQAVQTVYLFGNRAEGSIVTLIGVAASDASYETRRTIASALGRISFNDKTGPNMKALTALADRFAKDECAAVRMEALQALLLLGPPWAGVRKPDDKMPPPIEEKSAATIVKYMKARVGDPATKPKPTPGLEKDKQVEIWARLVLMRFDPKEINDDNLNAFAACLTGTDLGVRVQALQAMGLMGEAAGKKVDAVAGLLTDKDQPLPLTLATVQTLAAMGAGAKPAVPKLKEFGGEIKKVVDQIKNDERKMALALIQLKDKEKKDAEDALKIKENDRKTGEEIIKLIEEVVKHIETAKPAITGGSPGDPKKP